MNPEFFKVHEISWVHVTWLYPGHVIGHVRSAKSLLKPFKKFMLAKEIKNFWWNMFDWCYFLLSELIRLLTGARSLILNIQWNQFLMISTWTVHVTRLRNHVTWIKPYFAMYKLPDTVMKLKKNRNRNHCGPRWF